MTISFNLALELARKKINKSFDFTNYFDIRSIDLLFEACHCLLTIKQELAIAGLADKKFEIPEVFSKDFLSLNSEAS